MAGAAIFAYPHRAPRQLCVLVFIHHNTRRVRIAGVTAKPVTDWATQQARNLAMDLAEQASVVRPYLVV